MVRIERRGKVWVANYFWNDSNIVPFSNFVLNNNGKWVRTGGRVLSSSAEGGKALRAVEEEWQKLLSRMMLEEDDADSGPQGGAVHSDRDTK